MKELSEALLMAWQIAAIETGIAKHQFIEKEQLLIGICSLEKALISHNLNLNFDDRNIKKVKFEINIIKTLLSKYKLTPTSLRREMRKLYDQGNFNHNKKIVHRSANCKKFFERAELLANNSDEMRCIHLFAAILDNPEGIIDKILKEKDINPLEMQKKALFFARVEQRNYDNDSYVI